MRIFRSVSLVEQVAAHLRRELLQGTFGTKAPGVHRLAAELGVHHTTAEEALQMLEKEGLLVPQGAGKSRRIHIPEHFTPPSMRVGFLPYEETDRTSHFLLEIQHKLQDAGHEAGFASMTLHDLRMDAKRVARFVKDSDVDAWVIVAGPRGVLEWFADQAKPAFALFGRRRDVQIASIGPDKLPALTDAVNRLVAIGHSRIVMLLREEHRKPQPGFVAQALLNALESHGIKTGVYNLPDWENHPADLRRCLDSLFHSTPPSALIVDESFLFSMAQHHLARKGVLAPQHVSLICADPDPTFGLHRPHPLGQPEIGPPHRRLGEQRGARQARPPPKPHQGGIRRRRHNWPGTRNGFPVSRRMQIARPWLRAIPQTQERPQIEYPNLKICRGR